MVAIKVSKKHVAAVFSILINYNHTGIKSTNGIIYRLDEKAEEILGKLAIKRIPYKLL